MQLGPTSMKLASRAISVSWFCRAMPSSSAVSAKPEVKNVAPPTPLSMHCWSTMGANLRGTETMTKSISPGTSHEALVVLDAHGLDVGDLPLVDLDGVDGALEGAHGVEPGVAEGLLVSDDDGGLGVEKPVELGDVDGHYPAFSSRIIRASTAVRPSL